MNKHPLATIWFAAVAVLALTLASSQAADGEYHLADFGPVKTAAEAQATLEEATKQILAKGGGTLVVGPDANPDWTIANRAPSSTRRGTPSVTIIDRRDSREDIILPSNGRALGSAWTGRHLSRTVNQPIDMAFGVHSTQTMDTYITGGTSSWYFPSLFDIKKGKDQRIYVPTIRGLFEGMRMVLYAPDQQEEVTIKALGWDAEKKLSYAVADIEHNHAKGTVGDKHVVNSMTITDHSQSDNQSMGLLVQRKNYGIGDSFVISASARSMGNIMSCTGDEGGLAYAADIYNDLQPFRSQVESINWKTAELVYAPGATRNHTLGTSRPLINMNTNKWIRQGEICYVGPGNRDPWEPDKVITEGAVIGSKDCGWTPDIVGRFFTFDESSEYLDPKDDHGAGYTGPPDMRVYRWYQIHKLADHKEGTKRIWLERVRWNVQYYAPTLYDGNWFSYIPDAGKSRLKPMRYIIAPGAYVSDISRAWTDSEASGGQVSAASPRTLKLAPSPDAGGKFDFAKGDPVVQAIGPDPWNVTGLRVRHHNCLPSTIEDSTLQAVNLGRVTVDSALGIHGNGIDLQEARKVRGLRGFGKAIDIYATTDVGIRFGADVAEAAIRFEQPHNREQPILWYANNRPAAILGVDPGTGDFSLRGGPVHLENVLVEGPGGISASEAPAHNLRGVAIPVKPGATDCRVPFERPEADATYALAVQASWPTATAVVEKTGDAFTVQFEKPAPAGAKIDWLLVR